MDRVRIKKGVRPFGGKIVRVVERSNGEVHIIPPNSHALDANLSGTSLHVSVRVYYDHEVTGVDPWEPPALKGESK
jgi:hypothetical protein